MRKTATAGIILLLLSVSVVGLFHSVKASTTWSSPTLFSTSPPAFNILPAALQARDTRVYVAWESNRGDPSSTRFDIWYSILSGGIWSTPTNLTSKGSGNFNNAQPALVQHTNGTIFLFWTANFTGSYNIYYERYNSGVWSKRVALTTGVGMDVSPDATVSNNGTMFLMWSRRTISGGTATAQLFLKTLKNNVWSPEVQLTSDSTQNDAPGLTTTTDGTIWLVWQKWIRNAADSQVFSMKYNGTVWSPAVQLVFSSLLDSHPSIMQDRNGTIWIFWSRDLPLGGGLFELKLFAKNSIDNGATWSADQQITFDPVCCQIDDDDPVAIMTLYNNIWLFYDSDLPDASSFSIYYLTSSLIFPVHNVAASGISANPIVTYPGGMKSVGQNGIVKINVTVTNPGDFTENVVVQVTAVNKTSYMAGSATGAVAPGQARYLTINWNTSGVAAGRYKLVETVSPVPGETPGNIGNNTFSVKSVVHILPLGDVEQDGNVDIIDASTVALAFQTTPGTPHWNPYADINGNGIVDIIDVSIMAKNFGVVT